ncbi:MAG: hypothetical protein K9N06_10795 [Candidatus Cloacimonetes bacterium]|nr:hypothetical protein [Candidatus Cloacimonadota bacterium]
MRNTTFLFLMLIFGYLLSGTIIEVNIDGSGDYATIQEGINASVDGDTVLVYPGRYFENADFNGKTITLASLEMITGNRDYIHSTIIDGNQTGCCVAVHNEENAGTTLRGFTITNGIGYLDGSRRYGGGIYATNVEVQIINCIIEYNSARCGGGIQIEGGQVSLAGSTIRYNQASKLGGGIASYFLTNSIIFSPANRCNIYNNFSPLGFDIHNSLGAGVNTNVIVDTFTVSEPFGYEFYQGDGEYNQNYDMFFHVLNYKYERVEANLYVSPEGDDTNSGLTAEIPLQTINQALRVITADADNPRTIYLSDGIYSTLDNDQLFPISMRAYVSIIGESRENTIIDLGIGHQGFVIDLFSELNYELKNLTVRNGFVDDNDTFFHMGFYLLNSHNSDGQVIMENMKITDNELDDLITAGNINITLREIIFSNNFYEPNCCSFNYTKRESLERNVLMENCQNLNNENGKMYLASSPYLNPQNFGIDIVNCEFSGNVHYSEEIPNFKVGLSIFGFGGMDMNIVNCTFADNHMYGPSIGSAPIRILYGMDVEIINSIFFNNTSHSVIIEGQGDIMPVVTMHHNIFENGLDGILTSSAFILNWDEETNWDVDPLLMGEGEYPYSLQANSPAINMGTMDLPEGITLPEYDQAGNLRIMGSGIDLGAYECNPWSVNQWSTSVSEDEISSGNYLYVYPNPLISDQLRDGQAKILWMGDVCDEMQIEIFNVKGQRVRTLSKDGTRNSELGTRTAYWDLTDNSGSRVSSGVYFIRVKAEGEYLAQRKITLCN